MVFTYYFDNLFKRNGFCCKSCSIFRIFYYDEQIMKKRNNKLNIFVNDKVKNFVKIAVLVVVKDSEFLNTELKIIAKSDKSVLLDKIYISGKELKAKKFYNEFVECWYL